MAFLNKNLTLTTTTINRIAHGGSVCIWSGQIKDRDAWEFVLHKAREIRMANPDLHIRFDVDFYPEEVPCPWDPDDWVMANIGEIWASR